MYNNETSAVSTPTCSSISKSNVKMFSLFECSRSYNIVVLYDLKYFLGNISTSNAYQCKLAKKSHSCTFQNGIINDQRDDQGTLLLIAMAHQLCKLSGKD